MAVNEVFFGVGLEQAAQRLKWHMAEVDAGEEPVPSLVRAAAWATSVLNLTSSQRESFLNELGIVERVQPQGGTKLYLKEHSAVVDQTRRLMAVIGKVFIGQALDKIQSEGSYLVRPDRIEATLKDRDGSSNRYRVTIEPAEVDSTDRVGIPLTSLGFPALPPKLQDHVHLLSLCTYALGQDPDLAGQITDLSADGDNHDCEIIFRLDGQHYALKVRPTAQLEAT